MTGFTVNTPKTINKQAHNFLDTFSLIASKCFTDKAKDIRNIKDIPKNTGTDSVYINNAADNKDKNLHNHLIFT